jgi:hypothetical protein
VLFFIKPTAISLRWQSVLDNFHRSSDREFETYQAKQVKPHCLVSDYFWADCEKPGARDENIVLSWQVDMEVTGKRLSEAHVILSTEKSSLHRLLDRC